MSGRSSWRNHRTSLARVLFPLPVVPHSIEDRVEIARRYFEAYADRELAKRSGANDLVPRTPELIPRYTDIRPSLEEAVASSAPGWLRGTRLPSGW